MENRRDSLRRVKRMLVEIHMLQNHAPSNLNRDDTGSPKDAVFGGVRRVRISSQALKRAIRRSEIFERALESSGHGWRTRQLPERVRQILLERGLSEEMAQIGALKASGFGNKDGKEQAPRESDGLVRTAQTMFLTAADIEAVADVIYKAALEAKTPAQFRKVSVKSLEAQIRDGGRPITPDVALFGRMVTSSAFRDVESSIQCAHAISTHPMTHEFDFYTAVDDFEKPGESEEDRGADMMGDVEFTSACFYKYFSIDVDGIVDNLTTKGSDGVSAETARSMANATVIAFLEAAVFTSPSGKQNTFAAHQLPDAILVEVKSRKIPVSYANAFVNPVSLRSKEGLVVASVQRLAEHVKLMTQKFMLSSRRRLWFTTTQVDLDPAQSCETFPELVGALKAELERTPSDG